MSGRSGKLLKKMGSKNKEGKILWRSLTPEMRGEVRTIVDGIDGRVAPPLSAIILNDLVK